MLLQLAGVILSTSCNLSSYSLILAWALAQDASIPSVQQLIVNMSVPAHSSLSAL